MLCSYIRVAEGGTTDKQVTRSFPCGNFLEAFLPEELVHIYPKVTFNQSLSNDVLQGIQHSTLHSNTSATHCTHVCVLDRVRVGVCTHKITTEKPRKFICPKAKRNFWADLLNCIS